MFNRWRVPVKKEGARREREGSDVLGWGGWSWDWKERWDFKIKTVAKSKYLAIETKSSIYIYIRIPIYNTVTYNNSSLTLVSFLVGHSYYISKVLYSTLVGITRTCDRITLHNLYKLPTAQWPTLVSIICAGWFCNMLYRRTLFHSGNVVLLHRIGTSNNSYT